MGKINHVGEKSHYLLVQLCDHVVVAVRFENGKGAPALLQRLKFAAEVDADGASSRLLHFRFRRRSLRLGLQSSLEAVLFPFVEEVGFCLAQVDNLWAAVPVLLLLHALLAVVRV